MGAAELTGKVLAFAILFSLSFIVRSQDYSAGINTETPSPNAVLHLVAPNGDQGLIVPVLTNAQRSSFNPGVDNGLLVYDSDDDLFYYWLDGSWIPLVTPSTTPALGDVSGSFSSGFTVDEVGGVTSADIATIATTFANAPALDIDASDDITSVATDGSLTGDGTSGTPLGVSIVDPSLIGPGTATDGQRLQFDGTSSSWVPVTVPGVTAGSITTTEILDGTVQDIDIQDVDWTKILNAPIGTGANQLVQLNASGQLPAVDGSLLTGILSAVASDGVSLTGDGTVGNELAVLSVDPSLIAAGGATLAGQVLEWNGTNWVPGSNISALAAPLFDGTTIIGTGISTDAYRVNVGTLSGQILQFSVDNQLPALDGSLLTGVGDMTASIYDPNLIAGDVFNLTNHFTTTAPTTGDVLTFNGTSWDALAPAAGGGDIASVLGAGSDALNDSIVNLGAVGIKTLNPLSDIQIFDDFHIFHFDGVVEGEGIGHNIYPNGNDVFYTKAQPASMIFQQNGEITFLVSDGIGTANAVATTDLRDALLIENNTNIQLNGGLFLGDPLVGTEQDGMLRFDGLNLQGRQGGVWQNLVGGFNLPYTQTLALAGDMFALTNTDAITGGAGNFQISNVSNTGTALLAASDGAAGGRAFQAISNGNADAAEFSIFNASGTGTALLANTLGTGIAGSFEINNVANNNAALNAATDGSGPVLQANQKGTGVGFDLLMNATTSNSGILIAHNGNGSGIQLDMFGVSNSSPGIVVAHDGQGSAVALDINDATNGAPVIAAQTVGTGEAVLGYTTGTGNAGHFINDGTGNGSAITASVTQSTNGNPSIQINNSGTAAGLNVNNTGAGQGILVSSTNTAAGILVTNGGGGPGIEINATTPIKLPSGTAGHVLTSDGTGNITLQASSGGTFILDADNNLYANTSPALSTGTHNFLAGLNAGVGLTTGSNNTFIGQTAGLNVQDGLQNIGIGPNAGSAIISGQNNVLLGESAGGAIISGTNNIAIGQGADVTDNINPHNISIGSGAQSTGGSTIAVGLGAQALLLNAIAIGESASASGQGSIAIGRGTNVTTDDVAAIGDPSNGALAVGIGTVTPSAKLHALRASGSGGPVFMATNEGGTGRAGQFDITDVTNSDNVITATTTGLGTAGWFEINNSTGPNTVAALYASTNGTGAAILANHNGTSGDAVRIDRTAGGGRGLSINMNNLGGQGILVTNTNAGVNSIETDGAVDFGGDATMNGNVITPSLSSGLAITPTTRVVTLNATGAVTIANGVDGQELIIVCEGGAPTIADGGNIGLDTGVSFGMASGSTIHFIWNTTLGQWLEIGRSQ